MIIANRSIHIIDYENNRILSRDIPATFDEYVGEIFVLYERCCIIDVKARSLQLTYLS